MSEYWKSTPTYWCKHCKIYVRDTKFERQSHEATGKHQGNLKRFLRDLHRNNENDEREKARAKQEIARLNGIVGGGSAIASSSTGSTPAASSTRRAAAPTPRAAAATAAQRKEQLAQLVELGVAIPDEFRSQMAMAGEWQVTEERIISGPGSEQNPDTTAVGVHKRAVEKDEDEDEDEPNTKKRRWGSSYKTYPGTDAENSDLDALLTRPLMKTPVVKTEEVKTELEPEIKAEPRDDTAAADVPADAPLDAPRVKQEPADDEEVFAKTAPEAPADASVKQEGDETPSAVVFKKRKAKNIRHK